MGDPQTTPRRLFTVLDRYGLLGDDGWLRGDVGLVAIGDYFDFKGDRDEVERAGREVLSWFAAHSADQVVVLAGNHDLSRVMELAFETDETFAAARALAEEIVRASPGDAESALRQEFHQRFTRIPTPGIAQRDYSSFSAAQRSLVQRLLLEGRLRLATTASVGGTPALLTHAGVTLRELRLLGLPDQRDAFEIAAALNGLLDRAVESVRRAWTGGEPAAVDLSPVHVAGETRREGGGLLYHRPARRDRPSAKDVGWEFDVKAPRRFDPAALPAGLTQVAGHSGHHRCVRELEGWVDEGANTAAHAPLRTLQMGPAGPRYSAGVVPTGDAGALVLIDPGFAESPLEGIELLPLESAPVDATT